MKKLLLIGNMLVLSTSCTWFQDYKKDWEKKYHTHKINYNYKNSNYHAKNTDKRTIEVLITNY